MYFAHRVPRATLFDKLQGRVPLAATSGPNPVLTQAEEASLCQYIKDMAKVGYPLTAALVRREVKRVIDVDGRSTPFKDNLPGQFNAAVCCCCFPSSCFPCFFHVVYHVGNDF